MKKSLPSDSDITRKKTLFSEGVLATLRQNRKTVKVTVRDKLRLVNDELSHFKDSGISYRIICSLLADKLGLHVSEQTLREHCQVELGFGKRGTTLPSNKKNWTRSIQVSEQATEAISAQPLTLHQPTVPQQGSAQDHLHTQQVTNKQTGDMTSSPKTAQSTENTSYQIAIQTEKLLYHLEDY